MSKTHTLKTWPYYFQLSWEGRKPWEIRLNDRGFGVGDTLLLEEYDGKDGKYIGRQITASVTWVVDEAPGLKEGYVILSLDITARTEGGRVV